MMTTQNEKPDLDSLKTITVRYDDLDTFLAEITLDPPTATQIDSIGKDSEDEKVTISTIHSAKGLEWNTVFLISAVDGYIPSFRSLDDLSQLEEERRLLYVALTRAEKNLFIIKPNLDLSPTNFYRFSGMQFSKLSRFLEEANIIKEYSEQWVLTDETILEDISSDDENENSNLPSFLRNSTVTKKRKTVKTWQANSEPAKKYFF